MRGSAAILDEISDEIPAAFAERPFIRKPHQCGAPFEVSLPSHSCLGLSRMSRAAAGSGGGEPGTNSIHTQTHTHTLREREREREMGGGGGGLSAADRQVHNFVTL